MLVSTQPLHCDPHLLFEQLALAPDELVATRPDGCRPQAQAWVLVQVQYYGVPGAGSPPVCHHVMVRSKSLPPPRYHLPHVVGVHICWGQLPQSSHMKQGGKPVSYVHEAKTVNSALRKCIATNSNF